MTIGVVTRVFVVGTAASVGAVMMHGCAQVSGWAASGLLHPSRRVVDATLVEKYGREIFAGDGVSLEGWRIPARGPVRGTVVYLHGVADNRGSSLAALRLVARGFTLVAYDSRAHGGSTGDTCTFGFYEKRDLKRVLDGLDGVVAAPIVVIGSSLGAAVALQAAAEDRRIRAVVAAEAFSDLRTVATERAPKILTRKTIAQAFALAEKEGRFAVDDVSPRASAAGIAVPVLLLHGADDHETSPAHSQRIFDALAGPKRLILVPGAGHNQALRASSWPEIEAWIDAVLPAPR